jgi:hypothetical protein
MAATARDITVVWEAQPGPQSALISCPVYEIFFGGARGGGKTDGMLGDFLEHADAYGQHAVGLMVRRTRTELTETIERSKVIYRQLGWSFHEQDKMWRAPNGARLRFAYLERDADADAYQGHSYTRVYVEEIGNFPSDKPIRKLFACLRSGAGVPVGFRASGNPGGVGHQWVKSRYIDPAPRGWRIVKDTLTGLERVFIPSRVTDNKFLGDEYVNQLKAAGSNELVRAWLEGDWSVIQGAFFDCWSSRHIIAPFVIPGDWLRFRSADWGFASPFSVGWWAVVSDDWTMPDGNCLPRGALVRYREYYGGSGTGSSGGTGLRLTVETVAAEIVRKETGENIRYGVLDPSEFKQDGGPCRAETMNRIVLSAGKAPFRPADNARVAGKGGAVGGWDQMRARLVGDGERPMIYCFHTCVDSIRTIPALQHDPDKAEDLNTEQEDHAADEWRYACMSRPYVPKKIEKKVQKDELEFEVKNGQLVSNMNVMEWVQARMRKKRLKGF